MFKLTGMLRLYYAVMIAFSFNIKPALASDQDEADKLEARTLVEEMVMANGGYEKLWSLKDVEYEYTYFDIAENKKDVSIERYIFDGERSWARYTIHDKFVFPGQTGEVIEGYNGKEAWTTLNGRLVEDKDNLFLARFMRKTNYYWFAMMFKQLDPGLSYELLPERTVDGIRYKIVKVTFGQGVGDAQDTFILYLNPTTKLADRFLFTVMSFGIKDPLMMEVKYESINGVKLPTYRRYTAADWDGNLKSQSWKEEISKNIKFNNGFSAAMFDKP